MQNVFVYGTLRAGEVNDISSAAARHDITAPTLLGKTSTMVQMVTVAVALLVAADVRLFEAIRPGLLLATAALTIASGVQYMILAPRYVDWGTH